MKRRHFLRNGLWVTGALACPHIVRAQLLNGATLNGASLMNSSGIAYALSEDFEGTGAPSGWATGPDFDYTTTALDGAQSLNCSGGTSTWKNFTGGSQADLYCMFRFNAFPSSALVRCIGIVTNNNGDYCAFLRVYATGLVKLYLGGEGDSDFLADGLSLNTTYHLWITYITSGTCTLEFNTTATRTGTGNKFISKTGNVNTAGGIEIISFDGDDFIVDKVRVAVGNTIGSNPT